MRNFPSFIEAYVAHTTATEAPEQFHRWTAISLIASTIGRNLWIDQGHFKWYPNFYIFMIAKAGLGTKSTAMSIGKRILAESRVVRIGANSATWQALAKELKEAKRTFKSLKDGEWDPNADTTPYCTMSYFASELGNFLDFENRELVEFLTEMWDCPDDIWSRKTVSGGKLEIENPCLNMIGATTLNWVKNNYKHSLVGGGFSSRIIMILGRDKRALIPYPVLEKESPATLAMKPQLVEDIIAISKLYGPMSMTDEAIDYGRSWYRDHYMNPKKRRLQGEQYEGYYARKQTHMHKLAMILSVARGDDLTVTLDDLQLAHRMLDDTEGDLGELMEYAQVSGDYSTKKTELMNTIRATSPIEKDMLYQRVMMTMQAKEFDQILGDLVRGRAVTLRRSGSSLMVVMNGGPALRA